MTGLDNAGIPNPLAFPSITTQYILSVVDSATNCIDFDTVLIIVGNPLADAGSDTTICFGDTIIIGPDVVDSSFLYLWHPPSGLDNPNIPNPSALPSCGKSDYSLTVTDIATGCQDFDTLFVTVKCPVVNANAGPDLFCTPGNIGVPPSVGLVYSWTPVIRFST